MSLEEAEKAIPAVVHMFSGCEDKQTSADVSNVASFQLPDPAGRAGGALTSCMLNVTYADHKDTCRDFSYKEVLEEIRNGLQGQGFTQIPQLSSSRPTSMGDKFTLVPDGFTGTRRAVMIGINYIGHDPGELRGCHNDVGNMIDYIKTCHGFKDENITILMDDGKHTEPTANNIIAAYKQVVADSEEGDVVFCHYSGHGCSIPDQDGDEDDGMDEALCPVDYAKSGVLRDDDIFTILVAPMPKNVHMTVVMDCCHSGTILDLPFIFLADGTMEEMKLDEGFDFGPLLQLAKMGMDGLKSFMTGGKERRRKRRERWGKRLGF